MPIYDYECTQCGHRFEVKQSFHDKPQAACPQCKKKAKRVFHPTPIIFKGSGFYVTDHRKNTEPASTASSTDSGKGKTEAKTEAKKSAE
jgi:putative FmdB family regulatory protein